MKLVIFGATGSVGRLVVDQALALGHEVIAFTRNPQALQIEHDNLSRVTGDVLNPLEVSDVIKGADGVLVSLGSCKLTGEVRSVGTQHIVAAINIR